MIHIPLWRTLLIIAVCLFGIVFVSPNFFSKEQLASFPSWFPKNQIVLGLDLQGGAHLLLEVDFNAVEKEQLNTLADVARSALRKERIGYTGLSAKGNIVSFQLRESTEVEKVTALLQKEEREAAVTSSPEGQITLTLNESAIKERKKSALAQSIEIVRRRVDETGTAEPFIQQQGDDRILVQLPGLEDPTRIKNLLGKTAKLQFRFVDTSVTAEPGKPTPGNDILPEETNGKSRYLAVKKQVIVSGDSLVDAQPSFDQYNRPIVSFKFDSFGAKKFGDATKNNVGKLFAIVLDDKVISAPSINEPILGGSGQIYWLILSSRSSRPGPFDASRCPPGPPECH